MVYHAHKDIRDREMSEELWINDKIQLYIALLIHVQNTTEEILI